MCLINVENVSKSFPIFESSLDKLAYVFNIGNRTRKTYQVLQDVSLGIGKGDSIAVLGRNGCGKTTLLKLISGISPPDSGKIHRNGRISSIFSLGCAFHPEFSGVENIRFYAAVLGISKPAVEEQLESIISFADIGDFINYPVKTYSSGMKLRLAFSTVSSMDSEILVIDEVLAVGDAPFQAKCIERFKRLVNDGMTVIFASHSPGLVKKICTRAVVLDNASIVFDGPVDEAEECYRKINAENLQKKN